MFRNARRVSTTRPARKSAVCRSYTCESLEVRRMLSTIDWTNQGTGPANDTDGFDAMFGPAAAQARLIVERAIADWEAVIVDFQYAGGGNTFSLTVQTAALTSIADGLVTNSSGGKPTEGRIRIQNNPGVHYIDYSANDDAEFTTLTNAFTGYAPGVVATDLYATVLHELGHVTGINSQSGLSIQNFLTPTTIDDPNSTTAGNLVAYNFGGGPIEATFTLSDPGHLWEGPGNAASNAAGLPVHVDLLMNPGRAISPNERNLISDLEATILRDAYGYTVTMPSTLNNMYVNPNFTTGVLAINGTTAGETISLQSAVGGGLRASVGGFSETVPLPQISSINIAPGTGNDTVNLIANAGRPTTIVDLGGVNDALAITPVTAATITNTTISSSVIGTITPGGFERVTLNGGSGNDTFTIVSTPDLLLTINGNAGNDTLNITPNAQNFAAFNGSPTWDGGADADTLAFNTQTINLNMSFDVRGASVSMIAGAYSMLVPQVGFNYFSDSVVVNGGNGNDTIFLNESNLHGSFSGGVANDSFYVGGGNVGVSYTSATLSGGSGNDSLVLDDSLYNGAANWAINDVNVQRNVPGSAQSFSYAGFEGIGIKTGTAGGGTNNITTFGAIPVAVTVTGGAGADNFFINNFANEAAGGPAGPEQLQSTFDGGGGFNQLIVDDSARGILTYNMYPTRLEIIEVLADDGEFSFFGISAMSVAASDSLTTLNVYGTPAHIVPGNQTTVVLRGGNDVANVYPHDGLGNLTVTTNIGIIGDAGTDTFNVQDAASTGAINYSFSNPFGAGTQNIFGMGAGGLGTATIENLTVNAGSGADVFSVNQYASGTGLTLNGGFGNDVCEFGNNDVAANITSMSSFLFDGMDGTDTFNLRNATPNNSFTYTAASNTNLQVSRTFPSPYSVSLNYFNTDQKVVYAGPAVDVMNITSFASGELSFHGAGGNDAVNLPTSSDLLGRRFNFYGEAGTLNQINQVTNSKAAASTVHVGQNTIGAYPGDNFFAPGGSVYFESVHLVQVRLGSGADTAYAQPDAVAAISVVGGNPTTAPGDTINLALAGVTGSQINGTPASGSVTSTNRQTLTYSGFETGPTVDAVAPTVDIIDVTPDPRSNGVSSIQIVFSEAVTGVDRPEFSLTRDGGPNLLDGSEGLFPSGTNTWTLASISSRTATPGTYTLTLTAAGSGIADSAGNALTANASDSWLVVPLWLALASAASWNAGTHTLTVTGPTTIVADPGVDLPTINAAGPQAVVTINPAAGLQVHVAALNLSGGATATVTSLGGARTASNHRVLVLNSISIDSASLLDITDNDVIVNYAGASPVADIEDDVASGYNAGDWLGTGITSSTAAADPNFHVAVADNGLLAQPYGVSNGGPNFSGVNVPLNSVLIKFTHRVDLNLDGLVTQEDASILGGFYAENQAGATWATGDLDHDGFWTQEDASIFGGFYNEGLPQV